jgi:hypothetical protein
MEPGIFSFWEAKKKSRGHAGLTAEAIRNLFEAIVVVRQFATVHVASRSRNASRDWRPSKRVRSPRIMGWLRGPLPT